MERDDTGVQRNQDRIFAIVGLIALAFVLVYVVKYAQTGNITRMKYMLGGVATLALYSTLYRENPLYRAAEHIFIGLGVGFAIVSLWTETLRSKWYAPIADQHEWMWLWIIPLAMMAYLVFSRKHGWISRIPLGIIIGVTAGQIFQQFAQQYFRQINSSMKPLRPTMWTLANPHPNAPGTLSISEAISNLLFVGTMVAVLVYFLFAFEQKSRAVRGTAQLGRWLIMIGFGAIFGSTIMTRFALLVDRMYFILKDWLHIGVR